MTSPLLPNNDDSEPSDLDIIKTALDALQTHVGSLAPDSAECRELLAYKPELVQALNQLMRVAQEAAERLVVDRVGEALEHTFTELHIITGELHPDWGSVLIQRVHSERFVQAIASQLREALLLPEPPTTEN